MGELMGLAAEAVDATFRRFDDKPPFGIDPDQMTAYATDKLTRRLGGDRIRTGHRPVHDRPRRVAQKFHSEDQLVLTG